MGKTFRSWDVDQDWLLVLDRRTDRRFTGIGVSGMAWHRRAFRLLAMDLRPQKTAGEEFLVFARAIGGVGPDIASGVVLVDQFRQQRAVVTGSVGDSPAADQSMPRWFL